MSEHKLGFSDKGELTLPLFDLVEALSDEDKVKLAEMLAFDAALLRVVMSHVAEDYSHGFTECTWWHGSDIVAELRALLLPKMEPIMQELVRYLLKEVENANEGEKRCRRTMIDMRYAWPSGRVRCDHCDQWIGQAVQPPADPGWQYHSGPTIESVRALFTDIRAAHATDPED